MLPGCASVNNRQTGSTQRPLAVLQLRRSAESLNETDGQQRFGFRKHVLVLKGQLVRSGRVCARHSDCDSEVVRSDLRF